MINIKLIMLLIFLLLVSSCEQEKLYPWSNTDLNVVLKNNSEKMVLLDFETEW